MALALDVEHNGHDITIKGGEVTRHVRNFCQAEGYEFRLEGYDDAVSILFSRDYEPDRMTLIVAGLERRLRRHGYKINPPEEMLSSPALWTLEDFLSDSHHTLQ